MYAFFIAVELIFWIKYIRVGILNWFHVGLRLCYFIRVLIVIRYWVRISENLHPYQKGFCFWSHILFPTRRSFTLRLRCVVNLFLSLALFSALIIIIRIISLIVVLFLWICISHLHFVSSSLSRPTSCVSPFLSLCPALDLSLSLLFSVTLVVSYA